MSKINELIQTLCPDGVEWKRLGDVCDITTGKLNANAAVVNGKYMFFTCDSEPSHIDKYAFDTDAILISGNGSQVGHLHSYCGKFNAYQRTYVLDNFDRLVMKAYLYNYMNGYLRPYIMSNCRKGSVPYITLPMLQSFQIPIPHIAVQDEIVRILDEYTDLEAELEAKLSEEIELKQKQYEVYRDELLTFGDDVEYKKLGEVATISRGNGFQKKDFTEVGRPCIHYGQIFMHYSKMGITTSKTLTCIDDDKYEKNAKALPNDIVMAVTSENVEDVCKCVVWEGDEPVAVSGHTAIFHTEMNSKFLAYWFGSSDFYVQKVRLAHGTKVIEVTPAAMVDIVLPVPSLTEQERIVKILDKYDIYTRDMISTLNTELESRKKQYAYYRDQLLTFKRKE